MNKIFDVATHAATKTKITQWFTHWEVNTQINILTFLC